MQCDCETDWELDGAECQKSKLSCPTSQTPVDNAVVSEGLVACVERIPTLACKGPTTCGLPLIYSHSHLQCIPNDACTSGEDAVAHW